jgi:hypothetical protein
MAGATTCLCEPRNTRLCCDKTCCSLERGLNGNAVVEISIQQELPFTAPQVWPRQWWAEGRSWQPTLLARISHIAGFPTAFCDRSINGVIFFLTCGMLLSPVMVLLWTCFAIETTLKLGRSSGGVGGIVTRRSACCSWHTRVEGVTEVKCAYSDGEGPDPTFIHFSSGAEKLEISEGSVPELEAPVNAWIRSTVV